MTGIVLYPLLLVLFFVFRLTPIWRVKERGCDAFYFLITAKAFRQNRKIPIVTPDIYLLELNEQWYPPLFSILLGLLPSRWVESRYWLFNHLLDAMVLLLLVAWVENGYGPYMALLAGTAYASSPYLIDEYASMTSRPLATLQLVLFLLASYAWVHQGEAATLGIATLFGLSGVSI